MKIDHIALWVDNLEMMRDFYNKYFSLRCSDKYANESKDFSSYFLRFEDGSGIELMHRGKVEQSMGGYAHMAISLGSEENVNSLTGAFRMDGYKVIDGPRRTGDGYYESVVLDPEGNRIELTV